MNVDAKDVQELRNALYWAAADAHVGWMLYQRSDDRRTDHAKEFADCEVPICQTRLRLSSSKVETDG